MLTTQDTDPNAQAPFILWRPFVYTWRWLVPPSQADADRRSDSSRYVAAGLVVVICGALVSLALVFGRPMHGVYKTWSSNREVQKSKDYEAGDRPQEAVNAANKAVILDSDNPKALRQLARFATMYKSNSTAIGLWDKIDKLGQSNDDDVEWHIKALSNLGDDKAAEPRIEELLKKRKATEQMVKTADSVMQHLGRTGELLEILQNYSAQNPDDLDTKCLLGMRLVEFGQPKQVSEGIEMLWKIADNDKQPGLTAIEFLYKLKFDSESDQMHLIDRLQNHPLVKEDHRIAALRRLAELHPEKKLELMTKALQDRSKSKREDLPPVLRWFCDEHEFDKMLVFLKPREAQVQDYWPLLENYLNALTFTKQYNELERLVNDPKTRLTSAERATRRMHLGLVTQKDDETMNKLFEESLEANHFGNNPAEILSLARYAEDISLHVDALKAYKVSSGIPKIEREGHDGTQRLSYLIEALKAYKVASGIPKIEREGYDGTLRLSYLIGDSKTFYETSRQTVHRWPENQSYLERYLYACLLRGEEMEMVIERTKKLYSMRPNDTMRKLLMALAYYRMGQPDESLASLQYINLPDLSAGQCAVLCGMMRACNPKTADQAAQIAKQIPEGYTMLPEEKQFLQMVR